MSAKKRKFVWRPVCWLFRVEAVLQGEKEKCLAASMAKTRVVKSKTVQSGRCSTVDTYMAPKSK